MGLIISIASISIGIIIILVVWISWVSYIVQEIKSNGSLHEISEVEARELVKPLSGVTIIEDTKGGSEDY